MKMNSSKMGKYKSLMLPLSVSEALIALVQSSEILHSIVLNLRCRKAFNNTTYN
jgi:hypothetical protein